MSNMLKWASDSTESRPQARASPRRFPATVGRFDESADRAVIDGLTRWVEDRYREDLLKRPSKHVYIRTLPGPVIEQVDRLRDSPLIRSLIARQVPAGSVIEPMKHTDELYVSNYNKDHGGDQGLFDRHYDGNLRFLSSSVVVRALIYLQSDATYRVVFDDSRVEKALRPTISACWTFTASFIGSRANTTRPTASASSSSATIWLRPATLPCWGGRRSPPTPACSTS